MNPGIGQFQASQRVKSVLNSQSLLTAVTVRALQGWKLPPAVSPCGLWRGHTSAWRHKRKIEQPNIGGIMQKSEYATK